MNLSPSNDQIGPLRGLRVYVAGPYSLGPVVKNVRDAATLAARLMAAGHAPYCPHISFFLDLVCQRSWREWMSLDLTWLARCEVLIRLPGTSFGADVEVDYARRLGLHVCIGEDSFWANCERWMQKKVAAP